MILKNQNRKSRKVKRNKRMNIFKRKKQNTETTLESLQRLSGGAIQTVVNLISQLGDIDSQIDDEKKANEIKIQEIMNQQQSLDELKAKNEKIVSNFEGLLK